MSKDKEELSSAVSMRITDKEKEAIDKQATDQGLNVKEFLLNNTIYSKHDEQIEELERWNDTLAIKVNQLEGKEQEVTRLTAILESKDSRIDDLKNQLEQANTRLDDLTKLLDQSQQLQLSSQRKIDLLEEVKDDNSSNASSKGFFSRLFSGN